MRTPEQRFRNLVRFSHDGCWQWKGAVRKGYGVFWVNGKTVIAHRWLYGLLGPIPEGMQLDHTCSNRSCVRPSHLEVVDNRENSQRRTRKITHCPSGHDYAVHGKWYESKRENRVQRSRVCVLCRKMHNEKNNALATARRRELARKQLLTALGRE